MHKLIIIEDEVIIREGLKAAFPWQNHDIEVVGTYANGQEALDALSQQSVDLILLDINMPIMNGIEFLEQFDNPITSIIVLSGYDEFDYAKKAIENDVIDYILKPVRHDHLSVALEKGIKRNVERRLYLEQKEASQHFNVLPDVRYVNSISLRKALSFIHENYADKISLSDISNVAQRSATHINDRFQRELNMTSIEYLNRYRIQKAIEYISTLNYHMYEVSELVGFDDYKYFSQVFKRYSGQSPSAIEQYYLKIKP